MRFALLLLCVLSLAACPRQTNETVPVARAIPPEQRSSPASEKPMRPTAVESKAAAKPKTEIKATRLSGPELKPPIDYLELGSGFKPAVLPADVTGDFPGAKVSSDKSELSAKTGDDTVWIQAFTTKADDSAIGNYYSGLLGVKGFQSLDGKEDLRKGKRGRTKKKQMRSWRSGDKRFDVYVYDTGALATPSGEQQPRPVYVVEVHDRPASANGGTGP